MSGGYTICYRGSTTTGATALIVEDDTGAAHLFVGGTLQLRIGGERAGERLVALLGGPACWKGVPRVAPYTLIGLRELTRGARASPQPVAALAAAP